MSKCNVSSVQKNPLSQKSVEKLAKVIEVLETNEGLLSFKYLQSLKSDPVIIKAIVKYYEINIKRFKLAFSTKEKQTVFLAHLIYLELPIQKIKNFINLSDLEFDHVRCQDTILPIIFKGSGFTNQDYPFEILVFLRNYLRILVKSETLEFLKDTPVERQEKFINYIVAQKNQDYYYFIVDLENFLRSLLFLQVPFPERYIYNKSMILKLLREIFSSLTLESLDKVIRVMKNCTHFIEFDTIDLENFYKLYFSAFNDPVSQGKIVSFVSKFKVNFTADAFCSRIEGHLKIMTWRNSCLLKNEQNQLMEDFFANKLLPKVLLKIIFEYIYLDSVAPTISPLNTPDLIINFLGNYQKSTGMKFFFRSLGVSTQADIGTCSSYAVLYSLLPGALFNNDDVIMNEIFDSKAGERRERITNYFLDKVVDIKQGQEDISPALMQTCFEDEQFYVKKHFATTLEYNQLSQPILVPVICTQAKTARIGSADPLYKLNLVTNLVRLFFRFQEGKPIITPFLVFVNNQHWSTFIWIAKKNFTNACFALNSIKTCYPQLPFLPIKNLLEHPEKLKKFSADTLFDSYQEFKILDNNEIKMTSLIRKQFQALLECWHELAGHPGWKTLVNYPYFQKITSLVDDDLDNNSELILQPYIRKLSDKLTLWDQGRDSKHDSVPLPNPSPG